MKKYLLGFFAIVLAVGFSAFKPLVNYDFHYVAPGTDPFKSASVANPANWVETSISCDQTLLEVPCTINVPESTVNTGVTPKTLKSTTTINTSFTATDIYKVASGGSVSSFVNRIQ